MPYLYHFLNALEKLPPFKGTVYRGTNLLAEVKQLYLEQSPIHWSAFTSVSMNSKVAKEFAGNDGVVFHIRVKTARSLRIYSGTVIGNVSVQIDES